jgi:heptosyltransferase-1
MPAVSALRKALPETNIGWLVEERWAELLSSARSRGEAGNGIGPRLADRIHMVNTRRWRRAVFSRSTRQEIAAVVSDLRKMQYEVAIDFQGLIRSAVLAKLSGAHSVFGFAQPRERAARIFYRRRVLARGSHVVEKNLSLAEEAAGFGLACGAVEFAREEVAENDCDRWLEEHAIGQFVLLNPGAGWAAKQWPPERYGQLAKRLGELGFKALVNSGPGEQALARALENASQGSALAFEGSIPQLIALTRRASLFVGGDTGPMHLAAALGIPVVAIFGPTDPERNGPYRTASLVLRSPASATNHSRAQSDPALLTISPEQVIAACQKLLGGVRAG